jgi:hypothetical protein
MHFATVRVPWHVAELTPTERGLLVLDVAELVLVQLGAAMGWAPERFAPVRGYVIAQGLEYRWASDWKRSPDRRSQARMVFRIDDDGWGRARIEVESAGERRAGADFTCRGDVKHFRRLAKDLRWRDAAKLIRPGWVDGPRSSNEREAELAVVAEHDVRNNLGDFDAALRFLGAVAALHERPTVVADVQDLHGDPWPTPGGVDDSTPRPTVILRADDPLTF